MVQNIKATNMELTPAISAYVEDKLTYLIKYLNSHESSAVANVEVGKTTDHHKHGEVYLAEINLEVTGENYYVRVEKDDLYAAIDVAKDKLVEELRRAHARKNSLVRRGGRAIKGM
ncbi:MAG: ribosome-associated translation inhibitor RaiA, partial [bacterium]